MPTSLLRLVADLAGTSTEDVSSWKVEDVRTHARALLQLLQEHAHSVLVHCDEDTPDAEVLSANSGKSHLVDALRANEQGRLQYEQQELVAKSDAPIAQELINQKVNDEMQKRSLVDAAEHAELKRKMEEMEQKHEEERKAAQIAQKHAEDRKIAEIEQKHKEERKAAQIAQKHAEDRKIAEIEQKHEEERAEQSHLVDALYTKEQELDKLRAEKERLQCEQQELVAKSDAPIAQELINQKVNDEMQKRSLVDAAEHAELKRKMEEMEQKHEEERKAAQIAQKHAEDRKIAEIEQKHEEERAEQSHLVDALYTKEQELDKLRAEKERLQCEQQELVAKSDAPIAQELINQKVNDEMQKRSLVDAAEHAELKRKMEEMEQKHEEDRKAQKHAEDLKIAEMDQERKIWETVRTGLERELASKSDEIAGKMREASLSVPVRKGNAFEEEFEKLLRDRVLDKSPYFRGYTLTRTGGGARAHSGDHVLTVRNQRMLTEEKAYGTQEEGTDVPKEQVIKFKKDMLRHKVQRGVMVNKYGGISLSDGKPIQDFLIDGNILYIARMVHQDEDVVEKILFWWTMMLTQVEEMKNDAPVADMAEIVSQYSIVRHENRKALNANLIVEKVLIDNMSSHISKLAEYTGRRHARPRYPKGELGERVRKLTDADTGVSASAASSNPTGTLRENQPPEPKRLRAMSISGGASRRPWDLDKGNSVNDYSAGWC